MELNCVECTRLKDVERRDQKSARKLQAAASSSMEGAREYSAATDRAENARQARRDHEAQHSRKH